MWMFFISNLMINLGIAGFKILDFSEFKSWWSCVMHRILVLESTALGNMHAVWIAFKNVFKALCCWVTLISRLTVSVWWTNSAEWKCMPVCEFSNLCNFERKWSLWNYLCVVKVMMLYVNISVRTLYCN